MRSSLYPQLKRLSVWEFIQYQIEPGHRPRAHIITWGDSARSVFERKQATVKGGAVPVIHVSRRGPLVSSSSSSFRTRYRTVRYVTCTYLRSLYCIFWSGILAGSYFVCVGSPRTPRCRCHDSGCQFVNPGPVPGLYGWRIFRALQIPLEHSTDFKLLAAQSPWERRNCRMHRRQKRLLKLRRRLKRHKKQSAKKRRNRERPRTSLTRTRTLKRSSRMYQTIPHSQRAACLTKNLASRFAENGKQRTPLLKSLSKDHQAVEQTQL